MNQGQDKTCIDCISTFHRSKEQLIGLPDLPDLPVGPNRGQSRPPSLPGDTMNKPEAVTQGQHCRVIVAGIPSKAHSTGPGQDTLCRSISSLSMSTLRVSLLSRVTRRTVGQNTLFEGEEGCPFFSHISFLSRYCIILYSRISIHST